MQTVIAIPSLLPGGLNAPMCGHFGRSPAFTLVRMRDGQPVDVEVIPPTAHHEGGCLGVVGLLAGHGVNTAIVGGIGGRPLMGLLQAGIAVYQPGGDGSGRAAVAALTAGSLPRFDASMSCGGGHEHHEGASCCHNE